MEISLLNVRILFQKNETVVDAVGNHRMVWNDYYSCHATVSGEGGSETEAVGSTMDHSEMSFSVRFCKRSAEVTNTGFRILFAGEIYDILSVDHMNFKKKLLKFKCRKVGR